MSNETIMLAKNLNLKKLKFPVHASEKLDGVPAVFTGHQIGTIHLIDARTRQGEPIHSTDHIKQWLWGKLPVGHSLIGELYIPGLPFKDISGHVRKMKLNEDLVLFVWDYDTGEPNMSFEQRMNALVESDIGRFIYDDYEGSVRLINGTTLNSEEELLKHCERHTETFPESEGLIFRPLHGKESLWIPGKRSWGFQRWKAEETVDLQIIGFEEAVTGDTKEPKGMVGRIICGYKDTPIGVGPGALTHAERIDIWENQRDSLYKIIEVAYKPDPSYEALREARFKRFRDDKTSPNIE